LIIGSISLIYAIWKKDFFLGLKDIPRENWNVSDSILSKVIDEKKVKDT